MIPATSVVVPGKYTASFFANTDLANDQIASFYTGAMANAGEISMADFGSDLPELVVISPNDPAAMVKYARECKQLGIPYLYDPSQQMVRNQPEDLCEGVEGAFGLFVNEYEFDLLQKRTGFSAKKILDHCETGGGHPGRKGRRDLSQRAGIPHPAGDRRVQIATRPGWATPSAAVSCAGTGWDWTCKPAGRWVRWRPYIAWNSAARRRITIPRRSLSPATGRILTIRAH